jgi:hypothetical protein
MSAFVCSDETFNALAAFVVEREIGHPFNLYPASVAHCAGVDRFQFENLTDTEYAEKIINILLKENIRSVDCLYPHNAEPEADFVPMAISQSTLSRHKGKHSTIQLLKLCDHLEYQSCETPDYEETPAYKLINLIRKQLIKSLPGWESAKWGLPNG